MGMGLRRHWVVALFLALISTSSSAFVRLPLELRLFAADLVQATLPPDTTSAQRLRAVLEAHPETARALAEGAYDDALKAEGLDAAVDSLAQFRRTKLAGYRNGAAQSKNPFVSLIGRVRDWLVTQGLRKAPLPAVLDRVKAADWNQLGTAMKQEIMGFSLTKFDAFNKMMSGVDIPDPKKKKFVLDVVPQFFDHMTFEERVAMGDDLLRLPAGAGDTEILTQVVRNAGPVPEKIFQFIEGAPDDVQRALNASHESLKPVSFDAIERTLNADLVDWHRYFKSIDPKPVGTGSFNQTHRAFTHDGRAVAIKVQKEGVAERFERQVKAVQDIVKASADNRQYAPIIDTLAQSGRRELDPSREARGWKLMKAAYDTADGSVVVPKLHETLGDTEGAAHAVSKDAKFLVVDWANGKSLSKIKPTREITLELEHFYRLWLRTIYDADRKSKSPGFAHTDFHPGNMFIDEVSGRIYRHPIDPGHFVEISRDEIKGHIRILLGAEARDPALFVEGMRRFGKGLTAEQANVVQTAAKHWLSRGLKLSTTDRLKHIFEASIDGGVPVPENLVALERGRGLIEGLVRRGGGDPQIVVENFFESLMEAEASRYPGTLVGKMLRTFTGGPAEVRSDSLLDAKCIGAGARIMSDREAIERAAKEARVKAAVEAAREERRLKALPQADCLKALGAAGLQ